VEQQDTDGVPAYPGDQFAFDCFVGYQTHGPARTSRWRVAADHRDDPLLLAVLEQRCGPRPFPLVQRSFQTALAVSMYDLTNRLRSQGHTLGDLWCAHSLGQLQQRQSAQDYADLLDAAAEEFPQFLLVSCRDLNAQRRASHSPLCAQTFPCGNGFLEYFQAVRDLESDGLTNLPKLQEAGEATVPGLAAEAAIRTKNAPNGCGGFNVSGPQFHVRQVHNANLL
jgi:hypothetical protein